MAQQAVLESMCGCGCRRERERERERERACVVTELTHNKAGQAASIHSHSPGRGRVQPRRNHWHMGCRSADCASGSVTANERGPVTWTANVVTGRRGGATWELGGGRGRRRAGGEDGRTVRRRGYSNNTSTPPEARARVPRLTTLWRNCSGARPCRLVAARLSAVPACGSLSEDAVQHPGASRHQHQHQQTNKWKPGNRCT